MYSAMYDHPVVLDFPGPSAGNILLLKQLADHVISGFYSDLMVHGSGRYRAFLDEVVDRTARLAAK